MLYLVPVVISAYVCDRVTAVASAVAAVAALNFFFVPPRYTLAVKIGSISSRWRRCWASHCS